MFTGIIVAVGELLEAQDKARDRVLRIGAPTVAPRLRLGDSVAIDGVCQTVIEVDAASFRVHAIEETLRVTTLGTLARGAKVNLEPSLGAGEALGGHFVQGHVDGVARIVGRSEHGESIELVFEADPRLVAQLVPKGSIALDGISLTLAPMITRDRFSVYLIPHTQTATTLGVKPVGAAVNLETDILGKYLWRYLGKDGEGIDLERLRASGFGSSREGNA